MNRRTRPSSEGDTARKYAGAFFGLSARVKATGRLEYTAQKLLDMQNTMLKLYSGKPGVVTIRTDFLSIPELTKRVAQIIHRDIYEPANLMAMLKAHEASGHASP